jgi:DNA-binding XRE family transcriptional regulator
VEFFSTRQDGENFDRRFFHFDQSSAMKNIAEKLIDRESRPIRVGPRITALRETLRLSKAEFADSIGLNRSSLTKIEKGEMGLDIAMGERVAAIYGFGLDFIYRGDLSDVPLALRPQLLVNLVTFDARR